MVAEGGARHYADVCVGCSVRVEVKLCTSVLIDISSTNVYQ